MPPEKFLMRSCFRLWSSTTSSISSILLLRKLAVEVVEIGVELQVLVGREPGIEGRVLEDEADGRPDLVGVFCAVVSRDLGAARRWATGACRGC